MNEETVRVIATAIVAVAEIYALTGGSFPFLAWFLDLVATITGQLANKLADISITARLNYFMVVQT